MFLSKPFHFLWASTASPFFLEVFKAGSYWRALFGLGVSFWLLLCVCFLGWSGQFLGLVVLGFGCIELFAPRGDWYAFCSDDGPSTIRAWLAGPVS